MIETNFTPAPWTVEEVPGAGINIKATFTLRPKFGIEGVEIPKEVDAEVTIYNLTEPQEVNIGCERPVKFAPEGWAEMQLANAHLIKAAPKMYKWLLEAQETIDNSEAWWMGSPNKGGFDTEELDSILAEARGESDEHQ